MPAAVFNLSIEGNATLSQKIELHQDSATGALVDLTGYTAKMQIRTTPSTASPWITLTESSGLVLGGALAILAGTYPKRNDPPVYGLRGLKWLS